MDGEIEIEEVEQNVVRFDNEVVKKPPLINLLESPEYDRLREKLCADYQKHMIFIIERGEMTGEVAGKDMSVAQVAYPRLFQDAYPQSFDELQHFFTEHSSQLANEENKWEDFWNACVKSILNPYISENVILSGENLEGADYAKYTGFQFLCLLKRLKKASGKPPRNLVKELIKASDGFTVSPNNAEAADLSYRDFLNAAKVLGKIEPLIENRELLISLTENPRKVFTDIKILAEQIGVTYQPTIEARVVETRGSLWQKILKN